MARSFRCHKPADTPLHVGGKPSHVVATRHVGQRLFALVEATAKTGEHLKALLLGIRSFLTGIG